ncbi:hypothetical protein AB1Y20_017184 [Prymnesium parvum]|uniref:F-box domain-containing protein n=1 Tax=Prymnesium parvum TaxID=97485 RepID=A0AB34IBT3_PRYPA
MVDPTTIQHSLLPSSSSSPRSSCTSVLDTNTQLALHRMLHAPLTALQHETALRRHAACERCSLSDVLRVSDLGQRVFLLVALRWRGAFSRVCHEWNEVAKLCWQAEAFELVSVLQRTPLTDLEGPVAQLSSWVRASQHNKPVFFLLALSEEGRLEQMRVACKRAEPGVRRPDADDEFKACVENTKGWRLENAIPRDRPSHGVAAQFVVTKHHAYCVIAAREQALLIKLGGQHNGLHEAMYTARFPEKVTTMSMCPLDNNIIAFGVPVSSDDGASNLIELVNFAQSARIQTLRTSHRLPMIALDYSPDSEQLLSCSADSVHVWGKEVLGRGPGAMEEKPERTLVLPKGTTIRIAKVHPAWTSVLLATNEALEVRELRRPSGETLQLREPDDRSLVLKWRRENMQVTAAAFIAQGNMLVVSDRGDRLLLLNYHGLHAAKRAVLTWESPAASKLPLWPADGSVCTVTAITECPDVARSEEWRSGVSHLAVSNSRGQVVLLKI